LILIKYYDIIKIKRRKKMSYKNIEEFFNDKAVLSEEEYNALAKDRLAFGFDSIYFRYAEVCDELAMYKSLANRTPAIEESKHMSWRKRHFYEALEQLVHAHPDRNQEESK
jgi:hypothetical protein